MTFSTRTKTPSNVYTINEKILQTTDCFKYIGVYLSADLSCSAHIDHTTNKAFQKLRLIKRRLHLAKSETKLHAHTTLIRSGLKYASIIWTPSGVSLINRLESVQNKAVRFILSSYSPYQSVSLVKQTINIPDLITRRKFSRLSFFHSLYYGDSPFAADRFDPAHDISSLTDHSCKVQPISARTLKYQTSPLLLSVADWNSLPNDIVTQTDLAHFQTKLSAHIVSLNSP